MLSSKKEEITKRIAEADRLRREKEAAGKVNSPVSSSQPTSTATTSKKKGR